MELELTLIEQYVLLAIMRLRDNAYGISVMDEIKNRTGKALSVGAIYAVLERLQNNGMITSREGEPTSKRGGRKKLYFSLTGHGAIALTASQNAINALRDGTGWGAQHA